MKLCRILLLMIMLAPFTAQAQEKNMQVEVYLKDRSIVRGTIIEETPQVSITLRTDDGNIVVYKMEEIEKYRQNYFQQTNNVKTNKVKKTNGYRGYVELGYSFVRYHGRGKLDNRIELLTSHGYRMLSQLFVGIGTGLQLYPYTNDNDGVGFLIPIFADVRYDILKKPLTPFIDLKIGGTVWEDTGFYMSPSIGCRFPLGGSSGLNLRLGYSMQRIKRLRGGWREIDDEGRWHWYHDNKRRNRGAFTLTVGVDF